MFELTENTGNSGNEAIKATAYDVPSITEWWELQELHPSVETKSLKKNWVITHNSVFVIVLTSVVSGRWKYGNPAGIYEAWGNLRKPEGGLRVTGANTRPT